jgi:aspartyl-tRNA(Asn)/glutamyl-tRNA(Gln) amidotransferase subunit A
MEQERLRVAHLMAVFHLKYDLVLCPAVPGGPPSTDAKLDDIEDVFWNVWAAWTPLFNASRQPAISIPCGVGHGGLPLSVQVAAAQYREDLVLRAARVLELATPMPRPDMTANQGWVQA